MARAQTWTSAAVAVIAGTALFWPAMAQEGQQPKPGATPATPPANAQPHRGDEGERGAGERGRSKWAEEYRQELREHPRLARAIVALHEAKEYLEKAPNEFGGHKAAAIKECDDALGELKQALKFDAKRSDEKKEGEKSEKGKDQGQGTGEGRGRGRGGNDKK